MSWLDQAKQLTEGKKTRIQCCKSDRSMIISNSNSGYGAYCFRCGLNEFEPHGERSISQILKGKAEIIFKRSRTINIPDDFISILKAIPEAQSWVLKAGISLEIADMYGIGYSPVMNRVILPVYPDAAKPPVYMQARALGNEHPKYINTSMPTGNVLFYAGITGIKSTLVVVEDILSAIKISSVQESASILGTNMTAERAYKIATQYDKVILWFDKDEAGHRCTKQALKELSLQGIEDIRIIQTEKDPKCFSHQEIETIIDAALKDKVGGAF